jgi:hypothetical protein
MISVLLASAARAAARALRSDAGLLWTEAEDWAATDEAVARAPAVSKAWALVGCLMRNFSGTFRVLDVARTRMAKMPPAEARRDGLVVARRVSLAKRVKSPCRQTA